MSKGNLISISIIGGVFLLSGLHYEITGDIFFLRIVISTLFLALGVTVIFGFTKMRAKANSTQSWVNTHGRILSAEMTEYDYSSGSSTYGVSLKYEYEVHGERFLGTLITTDNPDLSCRSSKKTRSRLDRYKPGVDVTVYYSEGNPECAVLLRGQGTPLPTRMGIWFISLVLCSIGIAGLLGFIE